MAQRRARQRPRAVVGAPPLPHAAPGPAGRRREGPAAHQPVRQGPPAEGPDAAMAVLTWDAGVALAEAHPEQYKPLIYVAIDTGMRWSELVGLRRGEVDVVRRKVRVTEQLVQLDDGAWSAARPKTSAGVRTITISPAPPAMLGEHLDRLRPPTTPDALVFTNGAGKPLQHSSFQTHQFGRRPSAAAGVSCRFHDLRHTSVALAIASGAHPKAIQVRMGHSSITVTLDRYGHLFPELDEAIAAAFDQGWTEARAAAGVT